MDGTSISFMDVTWFSGATGPCGPEPIRLGAIGHPVGRSADRTESKLFPNGTKAVSENRGTEGRSRAGRPSVPR
ncbi:hypothetical protein, partial [Streptomyces prasinopilosus]|uniref:hypothetical protein n=1 Tax=Streptomyces prasinopilosus TaxID=67344 RepID=UPI0019CFA207